MPHVSSIGFQNPDLNITSQKSRSTIRFQYIDFPKAIYKIIHSNIQNLQVICLKSEITPLRFRKSQQLRTNVMFRNSFENVKVNKTLKK